MPDVPSLGNGVAVPIADEDFPALLETLRIDNLPIAQEEFFVDWMGVRTRIAMLPWAPSELAGTTSRLLPIPDDGYRSEDFEYVALARAIFDVADHPLRIIEIGAGWAPWAVGALVAARHRGLPAIGVAVEADRRKCAWAVQHARDNTINVVEITGKPRHLGKRLRDAVERWKPDTQLLVVVEAAAWHETGTVEFPDAPVDDMGTAVWTFPGTDVDYRGAHLRHTKIPAISVHELLEAVRTPNDAPIDLLHVDVQGVEFELLERTAGAIQDHTRLMAVGTHNRLSEGQLQYFFLERGWGLLIDKPCKAHFTMTHPTLSGFTEQDGMQLWENPFVLQR
jgi:FkbM family methyltransferase